jgi:hypothetical protein
MALSGLDLESQIRGYLMGPIVAFNEYIFSDVIPSFGNLDERANKVAEDYYNRIGSQRLVKIATSLWGLSLRMQRTKESTGTK